MDLKSCFALLSRSLLLIPIQLELLFIFLAVPLIDAELYTVNEAHARRGQSQKPRPLPGEAAEKVDQGAN